MVPRAAFFDFGGTLFSYRSVQGTPYHPLLREALGRLGVGPEAGSAGPAWRRASADAFRAFHTRPYYLHKELFQETFRRFAALLGREASGEVLEWFHGAQRDLVVQGFELRPGCVETLTALRAAGIHTAIVSNIDEDYLVPMIERAGLAPHLDAWTSSEAAGSCKPHAAIFEHALRLAGARPAEAVFVGDSPEHDIAGARRIGLRTILIRDGDLENPGAGAGEAGEPDHVVHDLREIPALLGLRDLAQRP
ncbi:MAG TPA: HAD family hydrolase [Myxococcota bacterium]|nr:HAD family hydrolase [Myxococcota bacterium]